MLRSISNSVNRFVAESLEGRVLFATAPLNYSSLANISAGSPSSLPEQFQSLNGKVLFLAYNPTQGQMLWSTDGTAAGTSMIADINPNPRNGTFQGYGQASLVIGSEMYFAGTDYAHGTELWKTDGTTAGTQLVGDLNPGLDSSDFSGFTNFNGKLAFQANGNLWISDGTPAGTHSLGNYAPAGNGGAADRMAVLGNELYFFRYSTTNPTGHDTGELWKTDGTAAGTTMVTDLSPGNDGRDGVNSTPADLITVDNQLYFAGDDGVHGWELYRSDGSAAGTSMVSDIAPALTTGAPSDGSYPSELTDVDGALYFTASANYGTPFLYKLGNENDPELVSTAGQSPQNLIADGSDLYFTATDASHGRELWSSDGTVGGTQLLDDIQPGSADSAVADITPVGNRIFFSANDGTNGPELWESDGTAEGTTLYASSVQPPTGSNPGSFTAINGQLVFEANVFGSGEEPFSVAMPTATSPASPVVVLIIAPAPVIIPTVVVSPTVTMTASSKSEIDLKFSSDVSATFGRASFTLTDAATGLRIDPATIRITYDRKHDTARITFRNKSGNVLATGHYRLRIAAAKVKDASGHSMASGVSLAITVQRKRR